MISLDDRFEGALIGHSLTPGEMPRFCYSLNSIARILSRILDKSEENARQDVEDLVRDVHETHGAESPLFIDDSVSRTPRKEKSRIILPGQ